MTATRRMLLSTCSTAVLMTLGWASLPTSVLAQGAPGVTDQEIKLGGVFALSGPAKLVTDPYQRGMQLAFDQANAEGGLFGRKIVWLTEDDGYQPARALAGAKRLVERNGVFMLVGQVGTPPTSAIMPYAEQNKIPFFTLVSSPDQTKRYTFGLTVPYVDQMYVLTKYLVEKKGSKRLAFFYQNDDLGHSSRVGFERAMKEAGLTPVVDVPYERGTTDFSTSVLKLRDAGADAVLAVGIAPATGTAIKQAGAVGYKPTWGTFSVGAGSAMHDVLGNEINGLFFVSEVYSQYSDVPAVAELKALLAKTYPDAQLEWGVMTGYAEGKVVVDALRAVGPHPTREAVVQVLDSGRTWDVGVMAPVSYGPGKRSAANSIAVFEWQDQMIVKLTDWIALENAR